MLNGCHALLDEYIYSTSRLALPVASLFLQYTYSFMYLVILITQRRLLDKLDLLGSLVTSSALEIASLNPIGHYKANCLSATLC